MFIKLENSVIKWSFKRDAAFGKRENETQQPEGRERDRVSFSLILGTSYMKLYKNRLFGPGWCGSVS